MNRRIWFVPAVALLAAGVIWWRRAEMVPAATWRIGSGTEIRQGRNFDALPPESPIRLSLHVGAPSHVYVFSHSREDGTLLMWPSPDITSDVSQPAPGGHTVLPGRHGDKELAWTTRTGIRAGTTFVVVAAAAPVPELEELLPRLRYWSNTVFPDGAMLVTQPTEATGELLGRPGTELPSALLQRAARRDPDRVSPNGPLEPDAELPGVFTGSWRIVEGQN